MKTYGLETESRTGSVARDGSRDELGERTETFEWLSRVQRSFQHQYGALFSSLSVADNVMAPMREHHDIPLALMQRLAQHYFRDIAESG